LVSSWPPLPTSASAEMIGRNAAGWRFFTQQGVQQHILYILLLIKTCIQF
jgi:collagenase-like PrtC family protease